MLSTIKNTFSFTKSQPSPKENIKPQTLSKEVPSQVKSTVEPQAIAPGPHSIMFASAQEVGYRRLETGETTPLHAEIEDVSVNTRNSSVLVLADGHGGTEAPLWFTKHASKSFSELLDSKTWSLETQEERDEFRKQAENIFAELDKEFCEMKAEKFVKNLQDPENNPKPDDDGCTLVVNLFVDGWLVNCNVGDTRTVLGALLQSDSEFAPPEPKRNYYERYNSNEVISLTRSSSNLDDEEMEDSQTFPPTPQFTVSHQTAEMNPVFASCDHNMTHPNKVSHILAYGGKFVQTFNRITPKFVQVGPASLRSYRPYSELIGARIYRPQNQTLDDIGVSNRRTLNLTSTMGDLLFKVAPAVMSAKPDVRFVKLHKGVDYIMVAGTDGIWDHLNEQQTQDKQNWLVLSTVHEALKSCVTVTPEALKDLSEALVRRESSEFLTDDFKGLFLTEMPRYDDATVQVVYIKG